MCGIVGILKTPGSPVKENEFSDFLTMLFRAESRGNQSTGVLYVLEDGRHFVLKGPAEASDAICFLPYRKNIRALYGHTRFSTGGSPNTNKNNHPHVTKNWVVVHNGCLSSRIPDTDLNLKTECDTEEVIATFEKIANDGEKQDIVEVMQKGFPFVSGSWSLGLYNIAEKRLFLTTNGGNPLECVYIDNGLLFASESAFFSDASSVKIAGKTVQSSIYIQKKDENLAKDNFSPETNVIWEYMDDGILKNVGKYEEDYSYYSSRKTAMSNGYYGQTSGTLWDDMDDYGVCSGYGYEKERRNQDWDLLSEDEWRYYKGLEPEQKVKTSFFKEIEAFGDINPVIFDIETMEPSFDRAYSITELINYVRDSIITDYDLYGIPKEVAEQYEATLKYSGRKDLSIKKSKPPRYIMAYIRDSFTKTMVYHFFETLDLSGHRHFKPEFWDMVEKEDTDKITRHVQSSVNWLYRCLIARFGVTFVNFTEPFTKEAHRKEVIDLTEIKTEESKDSCYVCKDCKIHMKATNTMDYIIYFCPKCANEMVLDKKTNCFIRRTS